jgi:tRNA G18 (ribose-2'-O)-methylase SpoU
VVRTLLGASRFRTRSVVVTPAALADVEDAVGEVPVYVVPEATIRGVVGFDFHRGCLASGEPRSGVSVEALLDARLLVVFERVSQPDNVGAVFRSALAFGADGVLLSPGSGDPLYRKTIRVSMGATLRVPFVRLGDWPGPLATLRAAGFAVIALDPHAAADVADVGCARRVALVLGCEEDGLSAAARAAVDSTAAIRMAPGVDSLNVATAAAIALHRFAR